MCLSLWSGHPSMSPLLIIRHCLRRSTFSHYGNSYSHNSGLLCNSGMHSFSFFPGTYYNKPKQFSTSCYLQIKVECSGSVRQSVILKPSQMDADACILSEFLVVSQCFIILRSSGSDCCLHVKWPSVQMSHHSHRILTVRRTQSSSQIQGRHQKS